MQEALKDPKYAKLELLDTVYGDDQSEKSYNQAQALVDKYPDMKLIMAPTSVGIVAAAKAMQDEGLCDKVKVSGLGVPSEMVAYTKNGCAPEFALWSFVDLGYLTYYASYVLATEAIKAEEGELQCRPHGRLHHHEGPDPRRRAAHPDGTVLGLQQGQRRGCREVATSSRRSAERVRDRAPVALLWTWSPQRRPLGCDGCGTGRDRLRGRCRRHELGKEHERGSGFKAKKSSAVPLVLPQMGFGGAPLGDLCTKIDRCRGRGDAIGGLGRRHPLLRHCALVRPRPERASDRPLPLSPAARRDNPVDQGRPRAPGARQSRNASTAACWAGGLQFDIAWTTAMTASCAPMRTACSGSA